MAKKYSTCKCKHKNLHLCKGEERRVRRIIKDLKEKRKNL